METAPRDGVCWVPAALPFWPLGKSQIKYLEFQPTDKIIKGPKKLSGLLEACIARHGPAQPLFSPWKHTGHHLCSVESTGPSNPQRNVMGKE